MKIAHVTATFPPYLAGTGNVAYHNARSLAELGHAVTVYTASVRGAPREESNGFQVRRLRPILRIGNAPLLPGLALLGRQDLVHLHYPFIFGAEMVRLVSRLKGQPYVLTYHNDLVSPGVKGALFTMYEKTVGRLVVGGARKVIVPSLDSAPSSPVLGPLLRAGDGRFEEIPNGVDVERFNPALDGHLIRTRYGIDRGSGHLLLFVGAMDRAHHPKSGVAVLLEAVARLRVRSLTVLLVGGGDMIDKYVALARRLGVADRAHFVGWVRPEELGRYYAAADVVVQPSQLFEPFGMVAIEAMACGRPVIASDLPGTRRVVSDAGGGLLAKPGDVGDLAARIEALTGDPALRARLGSAGRAAVEARYTWGRIGLMLDRAYHEALTSA